MAIVVVSYPYASKGKESYGQNILVNRDIISSKGVKNVHSIV